MDSKKRCPIFQVKTEMEECHKEVFTSHLKLKVKLKVISAWGILFPTPQLFKSQTLDYLFAHRAKRKNGNRSSPLNKEKSNIKEFLKKIKSSYIQTNSFSTWQETPTKDSLVTVSLHGNGLRLPCPQRNIRQQIQ